LRQVAFLRLTADFVPFGIGILSGLCVRNRSEHSFRGWIISAADARSPGRAVAETEVEAEVVSC
jgi:hypothetical protein